MELEGATALLIGAADRLGRSIAVVLAGAGANVVLVYRSSAAAATESVDLIRARGSDALALRADATDPAQIDSVVHAVLRRFAAIDLLVITAGAFRPTPLDTVTEDDWDEMMHANFETVRVSAERIGPEMRRGRGGCIITLADVAALRPWARYIPYCIAKSCVIALTTSLAAELAPTVRVNAILPGPVLFPADFSTEASQREIQRTALQRQGCPADIDSAILYLARNDYVTGTLLPVDGGRLLCR